MSKEVRFNSFAELGKEIAVAKKIAEETGSAVIVATQKPGRKSDEILTTPKQEFLQELRDLFEKYETIMSVEKADGGMSKENIINVQITDPKSGKTYWWDMPRSIDKLNF